MECFATLPINFTYNITHKQPLLHAFAVPLIATSQGLQNGIHSFTVGAQYERGSEKKKARNATCRVLKKKLTWNCYTFR